MPIYEYRCQQCGHQLEKLQRMNDPLLVDCPACEQPQLIKQISAVGFRLKGGGWYETDFKKDGKRNLASGDDTTSDKSSNETASDKSAANDKVKQPAGKSAEKTKDNKTPQPDASS